MTRPASATAPAFAALRIRGYRAHFTTYLLAMMADNIEHVISYWMCWQKFHSPALGGFAVVSHWLPSLFFGVASGALADRVDPRRPAALNWNPISGSAGAPPTPTGREAVRGCAGR